VTIGPDDTLGDVYFKQLFPLGVEALLEASTLVVEGRHSEQAQDESKASYEGWFHDVESEDPLGQPRRPDLQPDPRLQSGAGRLDDVGDEKVHFFDARKRTIRRHGQIRGKPGEITAITRTPSCSTPMAARSRCAASAPTGGRQDERRRVRPLSRARHGVREAVGWGRRSTPR
jgi:methionyl-tRNA formyltransferase